MRKEVVTLLHIVHINDTEAAGPVEWARVATAIATLKERGQCDLVVHTGDVVLGGADGPERVQMLNQLGVEVLTPGNHDLDHGLSSLEEQLQDPVARPVLANLAGTPFFIRYLLIRRRDLRIALTGAIMGDVARYQRNGNLDGVVVMPPVEAMVQLVPELRRQADLVVVLSHCGYDSDMALAAAVPGIDLIVGGHSHHALPEPVLVGTTAIVQAGAHCNYVGWASIGPDEPPRGGLIATADLTPEPGILKAANPKSGVGEAPVGWTEADLRLSEYACETPLGNLISDVVCQAAGADVSLIRCASVNNSFPAGPLTHANVAALCHVGEDRIALVELNGAELREVLECGARDRYYLLTLSGGTVVYDGDRAPGERVVEVTIRGSLLTADTVYTVACTEIMAKGACGFVPLLNRPFHLTPHTISAVLLRYVSDMGTICPALDGRMTILRPIPSAR